MTEATIPKVVVDVLASQMMALIALARALVETGAVRPEALIASLQDQLDKHQRGDVDARLALTLAELIRSLKREAGNARRH